MKNIILLTYLAAILCFQLFAQSHSDDCNNFVTKKYDRFTGKTLISATNKVLISQDGGKSGLSIELSPYNNEGVTMYIEIIQGACIIASSDMYFLFRDETRFVLKYAGPNNSMGRLYYHLLISGNFGVKNAGEINDAFRTKEVEVIRITTCDRGDAMSFEIDLTKQQSNLLMRTIDCLFEAVEDN